MAENVESEFRACTRGYCAFVRDCRVITRDDFGHFSDHYPRFMCRPPLTQSMFMCPIASKTSTQWAQSSKYPITETLDTIVEHLINSKIALSKV